MPGATFTRERALGADPSLADQDVAWHADAVCRKNGHNPDKWFSEYLKDRKDAANLCKEACTVREKCLRQALATREPYGIWGGEQFAGGKIVPLRGRGRPPKPPTPPTPSVPKPPSPPRPPTP